MGANLVNGELYLTGYVGSDVFEDCFDVVSILYALAPLKATEDLTVRLNSPGGSASEGAAIHALMTGRPGRVDIVIEGIAASAASLIAMAGETVTMGQGAVLMIHDPSGFTQGTSKDHSKTIEGLEALATAYAGVYAAKSGKTVKACREIMQEERWYSPEEAVEAGFADEVASSNKATMAAAFDYTVFAHAPQTLVALAIEQKWTAKKPSSPKTPE